MFLSTLHVVVDLFAVILVLDLHMFAPEAPAWRCVCTGCVEVARRRFASGLCPLLLLLLLCSLCACHHGSCAPGLPTCSCKASHIHGLRGLAAWFVVCCLCLCCCCWKERVLSFSRRGCFPFQGRAGAVFRVWIDLKISGCRHVDFVLCCCVGLWWHTHTKHITRTSFLCSSSHLCDPLSFSLRFFFPFLAAF